VKNHIHAVLMRLNVHLPGSDIFGVKGMAALRQLELPEAHGRVFQGWLDLLDFVREQLKALERELSQRLREDRRAAWLQSLPGVGRILAHVILAELGEIDRFPTDKHFASYAGTVPTTRQSGQHVHHGPAGYRCNPILQWALVEAATVAVRRDSYFAQLYHKHNRRKGYGKAIVIVAHRMARIIWQMLKEQRSYRPKVKTPVGPRKPLVAAASSPSRTVPVSG
jgi:transposase